MVKKDLSITFMGVKFPNPFCLSSSPVGNCYDMCAKAYREGWGGVVFKTIGPKHYFLPPKNLFTSKATSLPERTPQTTVFSP